METTANGFKRGTGRLSGIFKRARIPFVTLAAGVVLGVLLPAYISPIFVVHSRIEPMQSVINEFCPDVQSNIANVPIKTGSVVSAMVEASNFVRGSNVEILVNPGFSNYSLAFQTELMTHEYLHVLQAEDTAIDIQAFHQAVQLWFNDFSSGVPTPSGTGSNYTKYYLYFELYSSGRYTLADYPREEYAYIGTMLTEGRQTDVPANIQAYYTGILNGE